MKKLKTVTICLVIALIMIQYIAGASYYKRVLSEDLDLHFNAIFNLLMLALKLTLNIMVVVNGILALVSVDANVRDRSYSLLRYIYVMAYLVGFPLSVLSMITGAKYFFTNPATVAMILGQNALNITLVVFLIICKPEKPVKRVNLQDFDMVSFTTTGHRFVHYLLDSLFMVPLLMSLGTLMYTLGRTLYQNQLSLIVLFFVLLNFLMYYFISELIFRQTFGKMITKSCVVTNGVEYSNGRIFLRTLCRLIPFDRFSFLFGANWHDRASATAVVYVDSWESAFEDKANSEQI